MPSRSPSSTLRHTSHVNTPSITPHRTIEPSRAAHPAANRKMNGVVVAVLLATYPMEKSCRRMANSRIAKVAMALTTNTVTGNLRVLTRPVATARNP